MGHWRLRAGDDLPINVNRHRCKGMGAAVIQTWIHRKHVACPCDDHGLVKSPNERKNGTSMPATVAHDAMTSSMGAPICMRLAALASGVASAGMWLCMPPIARGRQTCLFATTASGITTAASKAFHMAFRTCADYDNNN